MILRDPCILKSSSVRLSRVESTVEHMWLVLKLVKFLENAEEERVYFEIQ